MPENILSTSRISNQFSLISIRLIDQLVFIFIILSSFGQPEEKDAGGGGARPAKLCAETALDLRTEGATRARERERKKYRGFEIKRIYKLVKAYSHLP